MQLYLDVDLAFIRFSTGRAPDRISDSLTRLILSLFLTPKLNKKGKKYFMTQNTPFEFVRVPKVRTAYIETLELELDSGSPVQIRANYKCLEGRFGCN